MKRVLIAVPIILAALVAAFIGVARSDWLRERIRAEIVAQAERATGGRVELGRFRFDWSGMTVTFDRFVIHGTEPPNDAPLLRVEKAVVGIRVVSLLNRDVSIKSITAEQPAGHVIIHADGSTNIPKPKIQKKPFDETILDLKIADFNLRQGTAQIDREGEPRRIVPWDAQGRNLSAHATYNTGQASYSADVALAPLHVNWQGRSIDATIAAKAQLQRGLIRIQSAHVEAEGAILNLTNASYNGTLSGDYDLAYTAKDISGQSKGRLRFVSPDDYQIEGSAQGDARGAQASARIELTPDKIQFRDARLKGYGGEALLNGDLRQLNQFRASGKLRHIDLKSACAAAPSACPQAPPPGVYITGAFEAAGNLRHISTASLQGSISGPNARGDVDVTYTGNQLRFGHTWAELPNTRVDLTGTLGERLSVKLQSSNIQDFAPLLKSFPAALNAAQISFEGEVTGPLANPRVAGHFGAAKLTWQDQTIDSISAQVVATSTGASLSSAAVVYKGIQVNGTGSIELADWLPTDNSKLTASLQTTNTPLPQVLTAAAHKEIDLTGALSATLQVTGTRADPHVTGEVTLTRGLLYGQPFDSITGSVQATGLKSQTFTGLFVSGPKRVNLTARLFSGNLLEFNATSNTMPLNQIALVRKQQPDILGFGKFHADGSVRFTLDAKHAIQYDLVSLNADASANGLELTGRNLGDARLIAQTKDGLLTARFDSNAAKATIHGEGSMRLDGDYPLNAKVTFTEAGINALATLIAKPEDAKNINFDGTAEGQLTVSGALKKRSDISAAFDIVKLEVHPLNLPLFSIVNNGPLHGVITTQTLRIENAKLTAPETDLTVGGAVTLNAQLPLDLRLRGAVNLAIARTFIPDLASSGILSIDAAMKGNWKTPDFSGRATIRNGDFHYADFTNGLTNANGELVFNGTRATIQSFSGDSGGGKIDATGFAAFSNGILAFRLDTNAHAVRVRYPEGVSSVSDAHLTLAGTSQRSQASGTVTVHRVAINPKSDAATILASTALPVRTAAVRTGLIENLNLDIQIETAPDVTLETSVTQTIQADANLRLRGTVTNPAVLGRINITQGELIFFGNKYSINQGAISFYNPARIDPILNIDLETKARGVDVILTVSGPVDKLNVSYRSDPPLQFSDIVALLATGRTPGDPTGAVRDLGQSQSFQQLGASELLGQAIANPVAGRLQRFFGVSRLKIDPQLTGITGSPQARLTLEQQVTPDILFTYITDVSSTSTQLIRVEWSYNRHWSAILTREENGYVGLDFAYKKRFK